MHNIRRINIPVMPTRGQKSMTRIVAGEYELIEFFFHGYGALSSKYGNRWSEWQAFDKGRKRQGKNPKPS